MCIGKIPKIWGCWVSGPLGRGWPRRNTPLPTCRIDKWYHSRSNGNQPKIWPLAFRPSRSLKAPDSVQLSWGRPVRISRRRVLRQNILTTQQRYC